MLHGRDDGHYYGLPKVIKHLGSQTEELSKKQRNNTPIGGLEEAATKMNAGAWHIVHVSLA